MKWHKCEDMQVINEKAKIKRRVRVVGERGGVEEMGRRLKRGEEENI